jgi:hypothetical protein
MAAWIQDVLNPEILRNFSRILIYLKKLFADLSWQPSYLLGEPNVCREID